MLAQGAQSTIECENHNRTTDLSHYFFSFRSLSNLVLVAKGQCFSVLFCSDDVEPLILMAVAMTLDHFIAEVLHLGCGTELTGRPGKFAYCCDGEATSMSLRRTSLFTVMLVLQVLVTMHVPKLPRHVVQLYP